MHLNGLFGAVKVTSHKPSLFEMAKERFGNNEELLKEITNYLRARRQSRNYPTRTSWEYQLDLLEKLPIVERVKSVHRSTVCGYRSIAYDNKHDVLVSRNKIDDSTQISTRGF